MLYLKQWGLKRTGTNYLRWLIENNFVDVKVLVDIYGWKHGFPTRYPDPNPVSWFPEWKPPFLPVTQQEFQAIQASEIGHIFLVKDPFAWIDSMARYKKIEVTDISDHDLSAFALQWNVTLHSYLDHQAHGEDTIILRYEDLLTEDGLDHSMKTVMEYFGYQSSVAFEQSGWASTHARFERGNDLQTPDECKITDTVLNKYYLDDRYLKHFSAEQIEVLDLVLSQELRKRFNYA